MTEKEREITASLFAAFKADAQEQIRAIVSGLDALAQGVDEEKQHEVVEAMFREAHNLKGGAMILRLGEVENICQLLETTFYSWKHRERNPTPAMLSVLHKTLASISHFLGAMGAVQADSEQRPLAGIVAQIERALMADAISSAAPPRQSAGLPPAIAEARPPTRQASQKLPEQTVRVSTAQLDSLMLQAEELIAAKLAAKQRVAELREMGAQLATWEREWAKRQPTVDTPGRRHDAMRTGNGPGATSQPLDRLVEFVEWNKAKVETLARSVTEATRLAEQDSRVLAGAIDNLLQDIRQVLLVPFSLLLELFPGVARDLARSQGKKVDLLINGAEFQVDRRILQELKDPLMHLVRNCIDHGIEQPEARAQAGKPLQGKVAVTVIQQEGSRVEIVVADDGAGIDLDQVWAAAVKQNIVSHAAAETLSARDIAAYVFQSGLSTSPVVTGVSGRGLGMAIVKQKVESLGGVVAVETEPGSGTTFRITLPLALAAMRGVLVRVAGQRFVFPATYVVSVARMACAEMRPSKTGSAALLNGKMVSLAPLAQILELPVQPVDGEGRAMPVVLVRYSSGPQLAFIVDEIEGEQEVLMKNLGPQLVRVRNIAGATVLSTGEVAPVLHVPDLIKAALNVVVPPRHAAGETAAKQQSILVVEDSITARTQLKSILELAGYAVQTAVDGVDAFAALQRQRFDLVMSDVDMPRMNGLDLTAKIREESRWVDLPVVLVTALDSSEDRERGMAVGANAYVVKKNFDQGNLLDVIRRLI